MQATSLEGAIALLRARLAAWLLHEPLVQELRALLSRPTAEEYQEQTYAVVSSWQLTTVVLATLRQQVLGTWSEARLRECLPRLGRYLVSRTRRPHQESEVRAFLIGLRTKPPRRQLAAA